MVMVGATMQSSYLDVREHRISTKRMALLSGN